MTPKTTTDRVEGLGLHTGARCGAQIRRAPKGSGIVFRTRRGEIPATPACIDPHAQRTTRLVDQAAGVGMVEHFLAAAGALGLVDLIVDVDGPEMPALDGTALGWWTLMRPLSDSTLKFFTMDAPIRAVLGESWALITPLGEGEHPSVSVEIEFSLASIGRQRCNFEPLAMSFEDQFAPARTFALQSEVGALLDNKLARGGSLDNALVFAEDGPLNQEGLRFENEPARHKLVDAMGDFMLLGGWPWARVELWRPSHKLLFEVVRQVETSGFKVVSTNKITLAGEP